ncbi:MAG: dienelactone hydrolase family protein [Lentisphaerae bacterium]|nr:dienelactone hydrolase family protein [Lentisphaerota bacterium]
MSPEILAAHDELFEGRLSRQEFLKMLARVAGGAGAASALLAPHDRGDAGAQTTSTEGATVHTDTIEYPGETGAVRAYQARPEGEEKVPGVVVIHENRGLNAHIGDVARRVAEEGFLAIAPDALSPVGGTPEDPDEARSLIGQLDSEATVKDFLAAIAYLRTHPSSTGKVGAVGFCWGGKMANQMAVHSPELAAAVPFYGSHPAPEDVPKIKASLLLHYAGLDERINKGIPAFEAALKEASVDYTLHVYEGAQHAFHNDTNPGRYHPEAADLAWRRTILFLKDKLKT